MFMQTLISKSQILDGLCNGRIEITDLAESTGCPDSSNVVAKFGTVCVPFAGDAGKAISAEEFQAKHSASEITDMIYETINKAPYVGYTEEESKQWLYFKKILFIR